MKITNTRLMEIIKEEYQRVLAEKKVINPGPYIDGPRGPEGADVDSDGDGVPNGADPKPLDGSVTSENLEEEELDEEIEIIE